MNLSIGHYIAKREFIASEEIIYVGEVIDITGICAAGSTIIFSFWRFGAEDVIEMILSEKEFNERLSLLEVKPPQDHMNCEFVIKSITRQSLVDAGYDEKRIMALSDDEMEEIAEKMRKAYCEWSDTFSVDLSLCVAPILS